MLGTTIRKNLLMFKPIRTMKVKELIEILENIEDKDRDLQILVGDEDRDYFASDQLNVMHTDDVEQCVEIFIQKENLYEI